MTATTLRRRRDGLYDQVRPALPPDEGTYYAFAEVGSVIEAWLYAGGSFSETRGSIDVDGAWPPRDPVVFGDELVGDGALLWTSEARDLRVWSVRDEALYTRAATAGWAAAGAGYVSGKIWWGEVEATDYDGSHLRVRLWQADPDLTNAVVVRTYEFVPFGGAVVAIARAFALTELVALFTLQWDDPLNGEVQGEVTVASPLNGGDPSQGLIASYDDLGHPEAGGGAVSATLGADGTLHRVPPDPDGETVDHWPAGWGLDQVDQAGVSADHTEAWLYGELGEGRGLVRGPVVGPFDGDPVVVEVLDHEGTFPQVMGIAT